MGALAFGCPRHLMTFDFSSTKETGHIPPQQQPLGHKQQLCEFSVYLLLVGCIEDYIMRYFSHIATWKQEITNVWNSSVEVGDRTPDLLLRKRSLTTRPPTCFLFSLTQSKPLAICWPCWQMDRPMGMVNSEFTFVLILTIWYTLHGHLMRATNFLMLLRHCIFPISF